MNWTSKEIKCYFYQTNINKVLLNNDKAGVRLVAILDLLNNTISEYDITDIVGELIYSSSIDIGEAIDLYYEEVNKYYDKE
jgi:hypothetical protein